MTRKATLSLILLALAAGTPVNSQVSIEGPKLIVTTPNLIATFNGPDLVRVMNRTTSELHINTISPQKPLTKVSMLRKTTGNLLNHGWRYGRSQDGGPPSSAQTELTDLSTRIWMNVVIDRDNQDITITLWAESRQDEVSGLSWGIRGLDLSAGKLILPALGGVAIDHKSAPQSLMLEYPRDWQAQMMVMESAHGGLILYTHDMDTLFKRFTLTRRGNYADVLLETQAIPPFGKNGSVKLLEWRLNSYKGEWMVPAGGYRNVMKFLRKPLDPRPPRDWVKEIRSVETFRTQNLKPEMVDEIEKRADPKQTLLYLTDWRTAPGDTDYPDFTPHPDAKVFLKHARDRGFRTMLRINVLGMQTASPEYSALSPYHAKDPVSGAPIEHILSPGAANAQRIAVINPASASFRRVLLQKLTPAMSELTPDALLLEGVGLAWNDGNGPLGNMNFVQGMVALERALLSSFPVVLAADQVNELIYPYVFISRRPIDPALPPHPICEFLFGDRVYFFNAPLPTKPAAATAEKQ
jgi:hypothetical protein